MRSSLVHWAMAAWLLSMFSGCGLLSPRVDVADTKPVEAPAPLTAQAGNGSIFHAANYRSCRANWWTSASR